VILLHTTAPEVRTGVWLPVVTERPVVCVDEVVIAWAGAMGTAASIRAAMTAKLKRT
jgi:hypothetical protein